MDTTCPVQENCQATDCSTPKENALGEKHELAAENVLSDPLLGAVTQNSCQSMEISSPVQNTAIGKSETGSRLVLGQTIDSACPVQMKCQSTGCLSPEQNALGEKIGLASEHVEGGPLLGSAAQDNCQPMEVSSPMQNAVDEKSEVVFGPVVDGSIDTAHLLQENCQAIDSSSQKQNASGEKHELASEHVRNDPSIGTVAQDNCQTMDTSRTIENTPIRKSEAGVGLVLGATVETARPVQENCQTTDSSSQLQNAVREKHKLASEPLLTDPSLGTVAQDNCQTRETSCSIENTTIKKSELGFGLLLGETVQSACALQENCQTTDCSRQTQNASGEKHELATDSVPSDPLLGNFGHDNCQTTENSSSIENTSIGKSEVGFRPELGEAMSTKTVGSDAGEKYQALHGPNLEEGTTQSDVHESFVEKIEMGSEDVLGKPVKTEIIGSGAEVSYQTVQSSILKERTIGEKHDLGSELKEVELKSFQTMDITSPNGVANEQAEGESMETGTLGSDSVAIELLGTPTVGTATTPDVATKGRKVSARSLKRKYALRSSSGSDRVLRSKLHDTSKPTEPSASSAIVAAEEKSKRKKRKKRKETSKDEFSKTRQHLRYLLTRMRYEHSLIEAYSGEGWKGQSSEKIKPEKELQRATSEILRCKRRIRDLFQQLDSLCTEGKLHDSLFDSEGQICSEDIFCAKCGSKDLSVDNDIILCDGICDRGFHQMCLQPPLLKEEIPPGDEGWLCPGCDCKVDCFDLLNDSQGTDIAIEDSWEKVFPEAAAIAIGDVLDKNFGLPSDDSEDDDYDPDGMEVDEEVQTDGSSSEESDFSSASDDSNPSPDKSQYIGLPSDDSEDDDYDPDARDIELIKTESSSSDFTSDSEYFSASSDANGPSVTDEVLMVPLVDGANPVNSELLALSESDPSQGNSAPLSRERKRERLDYKKLHDEEYGDGPSDSSDDEDWFEAEARNKSEEAGVTKESSLSPKTNSGASMRRSNKVTCQNSKGTGSRRTRRKLDSEGGNVLSGETHKDSPESDHTGKRIAASTSKTFGDAVTQRLYEVFKENEYPTRETKDNLVKELGITIQQVTRWFGNARWSSRHPSSHATSRGKKISPSMGALLAQTKGKLQENIGKNVAGSGVRDGESGKEDATECSNRDVEGTSVTMKCQKEFACPNSRTTRNSKMDHEMSKENSGNKEKQIDTPTAAGTAGTPTLRRSGRKKNQETPPSQIRTRSRKSDG